MDSSRLQLGLVALLAACSCDSSEAAHMDPGDPTGPSSAPAVEPARQPQPAATGTSRLSPEDARARLEAGALDFGSSELNWGDIEHAIYDLGTEPGNDVHDIHLDADGVYWSQKPGRLFRGAKDGSSEPELIGRWSTLGGFGITTTGEHIYWLDRATLYRRPKDGGPQEEIPLQWEYYGNDSLVAAGDYVYLAMPGCAAITRIHTETFESEDVYPEIGDFTNSPIFVAVDGEEIFCATSWEIYRLASWDAEPERIFSGPNTDRIWGIALLDESLYWINRPRSAVNYAYLWRIPRAGGEAERLRSPPEEIYPNGASRLVYSARERRLFHASHDWICSYHIDSREYALIGRDSPAGLAGDSRYLYWINADHTQTAVKRIPLTMRPFMTFE